MVYIYRVHILHFAFQGKLSFNPPLRAQQSISERDCDRSAPWTLGLAKPCPPYFSNEIRQTAPFSHPFRSDTTM